MFKLKPLAAVIREPAFTRKTPAGWPPETGRDKAIKGTT